MSNQNQSNKQKFFLSCWHYLGSSLLALKSISELLKIEPISEKFYKNHDFTKLFRSVVLCWGIYVIDVKHFSE